MKRFRIHRRALLRGAAGAALGLPLLDVMDGTKSARADVPGEGPCRFVMAYAGGTSLGHTRDAFKPSIVGAGYDLPESLEPLGPSLFDVRDDVTVVSGMSMPYATPEEAPTEPGTRSVTLHEGVPAPLLTGRSSWSDRYYATDDGPAPNARPARGPSATQAVSDMIGSDLPFPILDYSLDRSRSITYRTDETDPVSGQFSPRQAYTALVGAASASAPDPADTARRELLFRMRVSVLDLVQEDARRLGARLGRDDAQRVDQHFTELRALEERIVALEDRERGAYCTDPVDPGGDPIPDEVHAGYAGQDERGNAFNELIKTAFACDLSRTAGILFSGRQSAMNLFPVTGFDGDMHGLTHNGCDQTRGLEYAEALNRQMAAMVRWHVAQFAHLVRLLRDTPDGPDRTLLDSAALVFLTEGGWGYDPQTGRSTGAHSTENYCMLIAGRAGGLAPGRHVVAPGMHPTLVTTSAMSAVGAGSALNEIEGVVPSLFG